MSDIDIKRKIRETESNIKNWYVMDGELKSVSDYNLGMEKRYLKKLQSQLGLVGEDRIERLVNSIECFE